MGRKSRVAAGEEEAPERGPRSCRPILRRIDGSRIYPMEPEGLEDNKVGFLGDGVGVWWSSGALGW